MFNNVSFDTILAFLPCVMSDWTWQTVLQNYDSGRIMVVDILFLFFHIQYGSEVALNCLKKIITLVIISQTVQNLNEYKCVGTCVKKKVYLGQQLEN